MKKFFRVIHLYLSLAAGLVIAVVCFTGAVLVFEKELQEAFNPDRYYVTPSGKPLPLAQLVTGVQQEVPTGKVASVKVYTNPARTVEVGLMMPEKQGEGGGGHGPEKAQADKAEAGKKGPGGSGGGEAKKSGGGRPSHTAFVNPYTGHVQEVYTYRETFFYTMFALHRWLLGSQDGIGKLIVGVSTFIFLFILLTGIILWWPKTQKVLAQRLKVKLDGGWKRLNHDFHIVLGFYSAIFLFIFAFTGLAWSFKWFNDGIYKVTNSDMKPAEPPVSEYIVGASPVTLDAVLQTATQHIQNSDFYNISAPKDSAGIYAINVHQPGRQESATDNYYIDQYSGQVIGSLKFDDKNLGQRVRSTFKPVHTGSIFGLPSKIVALITCLLGVTFPVTGVILWLNRLKKNRKKKQKFRAPIRTTTARV
ncbi:membrane protein [Adhaeribacter aerolatus]|uniref:Membrane protein n=1 Tax=Adhaeribacter aerolatus TaxID=670289 RepID=A0A512ARX3_9BACT|nr:PepSY-associated TM helix domain-containing protein [Adhaeribacter aerolatus]GEO02460.1 membrane protein [Adhaeribacter aerolatus]